MPGKKILHVRDLPVDTRARELAREFERFGPIVRVDVPAPKRDARTAYAFVEFEDSRDAADAYDRLHGKRFRGESMYIEWAKKGPMPRRDRFNSEDRRGRSRSRSRSPRRNESFEADRRRITRSHSRSRSPSRSRSRSISRSPVRSKSPIRSPKMSDLEGSI